MSTFGFIGAGNMGGALARAAAKAIGGDRLVLTDVNSDKAAALASEIGAVSGDKAAALGCDFVFIGVKPQMLADMFDEIRSLLNKKTVLISMVAGTSIEKIKALSGGNPVIRIMPNTPVSVGEGMIMYAASGDVSPEQERDFSEAMASAGRLMKLPERLIDAGSAVSGCGPAYAYMFIEALADGGVACGLPRATAMELAGQMLLGSAKLALESGKHPGELKDAVCSPGGTTIHGVRTLEERAFRAAVTDAVIAAYEKTLSL